MRKVRTAQVPNKGESMQAWTRAEMLRHSSRTVCAQINEACEGICKSELRHHVGTGRSRLVVALDVAVKMFS